RVIASHGDNPAGLPEQQVRIGDETENPQLPIFLRLSHQPVLDLWWHEGAGQDHADRSGRKISLGKSLSQLAAVLSSSHQAENKVVALRPAGSGSTSPQGRSSRDFAGGGKNSSLFHSREVRRFASCQIACISNFGGHWRRKVIFRNRIEHTVIAVNPDRVVEL